MARRTRRAGFALLGLAAIVVSTVCTSGAFAEPPAEGSGPSPGATGDDPGGCAVSDVDYEVTASVMLRGTPLGAADGVHPLGSGTMRLRFERGDDTRTAKLMSYRVDNRMTVETTVAWIKTTVTAESRTGTQPDACQGSAQGTLSGSRLVWRGAVRGYGSEGTITCDGSMCGSFGAPPRGASALRDHPADLRFGTFVFSPDGSTFAMPYTQVPTTTKGSQKTFLGLSGRRVGRACLESPPACQIASRSRGDR
jgi:hypothetical protein